MQDGGVRRLFFPDGFVCVIAEYADDVAVIIEHAGHDFGLMHFADVVDAEPCGLGGFFQCDGGWLGLAAVAFALEAEFVVQRPEQECAYEAADPREKACDEVLDGLGVFFVDDTGEQGVVDHLAAQGDEGADEVEHDTPEYDVQQDTQYALSRRLPVAVAYYQVFRVDLHVGVPFGWVSRSVVSGRRLLCGC